MRKEVQGILKFIISAGLCVVALYYNFRPPELSVILWWIFCVLVLIYASQKE